MKALKVIRSGPLASIQDQGRFHVRHLGVTQGGGADWVALAWANWLLGNSSSAPVLEVTFGGLQLQALHPVTLALCGADLDAHLDQQALAPGQVFSMQRGQCLSFNQPRQGVRAYLAAPAGFCAPLLMGSCATVSREQLGGLAGDGQILSQDQLLMWSGEQPAQHRRLPDAARAAYTSEPQLDLILGAQVSQFSGVSLFQAFNQTWQVDRRADRMGVRLTGPKLQCSISNLVSEGIPLGAVQVPPDGQPIVLLNDRQTIGGYPRLGALTPYAVAQLAQLMPGSQLRLRPICLEQAQRQHRRLLNQWAD